MNRRRVVTVGAAAAVILFLGIGSAWILTLPPEPVAAAAAAIPAHEAAATVEALKPSRRARPLIAIVGINDATEATDYLMPYGILRRADVADVVALATEEGPVKLYQALSVEPQATVAEFDAQHPDGADYVIVPAMSRDDDPTAIRWIREQAAKGATVIGVCAGAKVVASTGLLDGRRATTHWYFLDELREENPAIHYVPDRRYVVDAGVATTTGITASMPMSLTLIEAIAERRKAEDVARELGVGDWDARHASDAFRFNRRFALTVIGNRLRVWRHERLGIELEPGIDEVSLALTADSWSRTYRSRAVTFSASRRPIETANGIRIIPDEIATQWPANRRLTSFVDLRPAEALEQTLRAISDRYGMATAKVVAVQLEYAGLDEGDGQDSGYVDVDGGRLYFETAGDGVPVVLIHGNLGDRRHWDEQFHAFAREFRVIRYDLRGFGRSSLPVEGHPYSHHDDLAALLRALEVDAAHIVGISMGSSIAADFALTHPGTALSLVSAGPWVSGYQSSSPDIQSMWAAYAAVTQAFEAGDTRAAMDAWSASPFWLKATPDTTVRERLRRIGHDHRFWEFAHEDPATNVEPRSVTQVGSIRMPTLVVTSEHDSMHEVADFLVGSIPNAQKAVIFDAGHMMQMDQPAVFNDVVSEFIRTRRY